MVSVAGLKEWKSKASPCLSHPTAPSAGPKNPHRLGSPQLWPWGPDNGSHQHLENMAPGLCVWPYVCQHRAVDNPHLQLCRSRLSFHDSPKVIAETQLSVLYSILPSHSHCFWSYGQGAVQNSVSFPPWSCPSLRAHHGSVRLTNWGLPQTSPTRTRGTSSGAGEQESL